MPPDDASGLASALTDTIEMGLRTRLTSLRGLARTLERDDLDLPPDLARQWASRILTEARALEVAIDDAALLVQLWQGDVPIRHHPTDLSGTVRGVVDGTEPGDRHLTTNCEAATILVDPRHLETIVHRLLDHALAKSPPRATVHVSARPDDGAVVITVEHAGPAPEPGNRAIAVVRGLARLHGGWMAVADGSRGGTTITVGVPEWNRSTEPHRVLVVDWDSDCQWAQDPELAASGYDVAVCGGLGVPHAVPDCPMVAEGRCSLVEAADAYVFSLRAPTDEALAVIRSYRDRAPDTPLVVEVPPAELDEFGEELDGCIVVPAPLNRDRVLDLLAGSLPNLVSQSRDGAGQEAKFGPTSVG
ncbi:MAG: HAMP domain-containing histidine kinase [Actinobacteria bacterium]|nr:HAMP domain-containing histidine kinase [Actinomycetota bacterium]